MPATPGVTVRRIVGKFELSNGQTVDFDISHIGGGGVSWQQWGNTDDNMFVSNGLAEELANAAREHLVEEPDQGPAAVSNGA